MNIVLIGYRCTGKTRTGKIIAKKLNFKFIDTDDLIEKEAKKNISKIVADDGWDKFRGLEKKVIQEVSNYNNIVISVGGGAIEENENAENLKKNSIVFWLIAEPEVIFERMQKDPMSATMRPNLTAQKDELLEIKTMLKKREAKYESASDYKIDTSTISKQEVAEKVINIMNKLK
ncbi:MAG: shikimate kinase [Candidatus Aenigmarchaeota archaeon]|nr:shikimate kinase [Candidatus Aenigmarchaeota archaeon]